MQPSLIGRIEFNTFSTAMADLEPHLSAIVRVLVVDDYEPFRGFVCATLKSRTEFLVVGEAADGSEAVQKAATLQPDLILLDIGLPKLNGLQAAHRICQLAPRTTILFISQDNDPDLIAEATGNGAKGYERKQNASRELLPAIEAVLLGGRFVSVG